MMRLFTVSEDCLFGGDEIGHLESKGGRGVRDLLVAGVEGGGEGGRSSTPVKKSELFMNGRQECYT